jgi:hypothetical protein
MAYGPNIPLMGSGVPDGPVPDVFFARTPAPYTSGTMNDVGGGMTNGVWEEIVRTLRDVGLTPKGQARAYQKPYQDYFDTLLYPHGFRVPDFTKFTGDDGRTTYEHIGQFLAQVNDMGITDVHNIRLFPLSLSRTTFNWFTSLAPNSIDNWPTLELGTSGCFLICEYFYNGEAELRLSDLSVIRQKHNETMSEYLRRFREMRNKCYNLTIGEKVLADLAFAGLSSYLRKKLEGQEFLDVNQVLQRVVVHENCARDLRSYNRFRDSGSKEREKSHANCVEEESASDDEAEVCVTEWVDTSRDKLIPCSFLKINHGNKDEI